MIQFEHVCKTYGKTPILKDLNFTIPDGQFVVLIGPSGCGKTTTLKTINRLIDIDSGTISIDGKDIHSQDKVEHFMRTNILTVKRDRGVLECAERMARGSVDTLLVTDEAGRYAGTVTIGDIRHWGRELTTIEPLVRQTARTARVGDEAKESFDYLLDSGANYVVVLNEDDTIAGIVTKTSVARSVAENLWGDAK